MIKTSKEEFYIDLKKFYDSGILKDVYSSDNVCLCNASNYGYIAFPYMKISTGSQIGVSFNSKGLTKFINDPTYVYKKLLYGDQQYMKECLVIMNDYTFDKLAEYKKQTDLNGPNSAIDLDLEKQIMSNSKKR